MVMHLSAKLAAVGVLWLTTLALAPAAAAAAPHRALFVGNSYTYFNDAGSLPKRYAALQAALGASPVVAESATTGGWTFAKHLQDAQTPGEALQTALGESWDVVWLQGQSQIPGFVGIPGGPFPAEEQAFVQLAKLASQKAVHLGLLLTWGRRDGDVQNASLFPDYSAMQTRLDKGVAQLAASAAKAGVPVDVVPIGAAFRAIHDAGAGSDSLFARLYSSDGSHPSPLGSHLSALCCVAALTGADVTKLPTPADLAASDVQALAAAADTACRSQGGRADDGDAGTSADAGGVASDTAQGSDTAEGTEVADSPTTSDSGGEGGEAAGAAGGGNADSSGCSAAHRPQRTMPWAALLGISLAALVLLGSRRRGLAPTT